MIIDIDKNVFITLVFIFLFSILLYVKKPEIMFDSSGNFKQYGTNTGQTLYPLWLVVTISSIVLYIFLVTRSNKFV